jgi:hypothetical protein
MQVSGMRLFLILILYPASYKGAVQFFFFFCGAILFRSWSSETSPVCFAPYLLAISAYGVSHLTVTWMKAWDSWHKNCLTCRRGTSFILVSTTKSNKNGAKGYIICVSCTAPRSWEGEAGLDLRRLAYQGCFESSSFLNNKRGHSGDPQCGFLLQIVFIKKGLE